MQQFESGFDKFSSTHSGADLVQLPSFQSKRFKKARNSSRDLRKSPIEFDPRVNDFLKVRKIWGIRNF